MVIRPDVVMNCQTQSGDHFVTHEVNFPRESGTLALVEDIPSLSGYATESWVSANFLSADTPIGGSAEWGSISGSLSDQADLMSKFSEYATVSALSSYATQNELSSYAKVSDLSNYTPLSEMSLYASVSALNSAISGVESTISSLDYLSVGALSSETVIPDITGLASEGYVNSAISSLSSIYASQAALSEYATVSTVSSLDYLSVGALSSGTTIPTIPSARSGITLHGGYYGLSMSIPDAKIFTGEVHFSSTTKFSSAACFETGVIYGS